MADPVLHRHLAEPAEPAWVATVREVVIPLLVWLVMMRFLVFKVLVPFFSSGMHRQLHRGPSDAAEVDGEAAADAGDDAMAIDDQPSEAAEDRKTK